MNRVLKNIIIPVVGVILWHLSGEASEAAVYKWKDENGKIHFTDDATRVPEKLRQNTMKFRPLPKPVIKNDPPSPREDQIAEPDKKEITTDATGKESAIGDPNALTEAEKSAAEAVIVFFEEDMSRYDSIYEYPISNRTSRMTKLRKLRRAVIDNIPQKEVLVKQLSSVELPLLKEITVFLQAALTEDEKLKKVLPQMFRNTRQRVNKIANRLKEQTAREEKFLEQLEEALADPAESEKK